MPYPSRKITILQVAQEASVSPTTVSLVLNGTESGGDRISLETRQRVIEASARLGYFPNQSARSLRRKKTDRICLAMSDLGIPYNNMLVSQVEALADNLGYTTIIAMTGSAEQERRSFEQLMRGLADGVIMLSPTHITSEEIASLARSGCAVALSTNKFLPSGVDVVRNTEDETARIGLQYLFDKGHRRIAYIGLLSSETTAFLRYEAYRQFMHDHNLPIEQGFIQHDRGVARENAYFRSRALLDLPVRPTALFAGSDLAAISAINAFKDAGLKIPEEMAVLGSGNIPEGEICNPSLTTIGPARLDFSELINFLFSRLRGEAPAEGRQHTIFWQLIRRNSA